jgi:hypothetical protein
MLALRFYGLITIKRIHLPFCGGFQCAHHPARSSDSVRLFLPLM